MIRQFVIALLTLFLAICGACRKPQQQQQQPPPPLADLNDNLTPAGTLAEGVLTLRLEVQLGVWRSDGPTGLAVRAPMFAEEGRAPAVPGPMIRVPSGTRVKLHVKNALPSASVELHGLHDRPGHTDSATLLAPGKASDFDFAAGPPGTYFYWGSTDQSEPVKEISDRLSYDGVLSGAFIVDPPGIASPPDDRVLMLANWADNGPNPVPELKDRSTFLINGRSFPATEELTYPVGRPIHWRIINTSDEEHPMHLHGTYFSVDAAGDDSDMTPASQAPPMEVTHLIESGHTAAITWTPHEPGHWLFHCHILFHVGPEQRLTRPVAASGHEEHNAEDPGQHMGGLVLGINVLPAGDMPARPSHERQLMLEVGERPNVKFASGEDKPLPGLGYRLVDSGSAAPSPFSGPGPVLVLTRGEPVAISVMNRLSKATTVHWHGIELESYYDGVAGYGTEGSRVTPSIKPGATFVARFTPPRAGTFMYHTHLNDYEQLSTGLYGAIVVVDPGERFNPDLDRVFVLSRGGPDDVRDPVLLNGSEWPDEQVLHRGVTYRFRFACITPAPSVTVSLRSGETLFDWTPLAKDGSAFAGGRPKTRAQQTVQPGETYDFAFTPAVEGPVRLVARLGRLHTELMLHVK